MSDFHELPIWYEARRLTLAAFQFTARRVEQTGPSPVGSEIQNTCVLILSAIQHLTEPRSAQGNPRKAASEALRKLTSLLGRAYAEGLISTFELALVMRALSSVNDFLATNGAGETCCLASAGRALAVPLLPN